MEGLISRIEEASSVLAELLGDRQPVCGIILGSGLNPYAETLENRAVLPYADVPHMHTSTAEGHVGRFVVGTVPGTDRDVLCMQGRLHGYEGNTAQDVALPVWCMQRVGVPVLITTNAAGAINPSFNVGDFCLMTDHINLTGHNPIVGREAAQMNQRFVPMLDCYDPALRTLALAVAERENVSLHQGVYVAMLGPSFETPAEIRMLATLGADTVAMSVVEEVIAARHMGMRVMGVSMLSNMACGVAGGDPTEDEIMDVAVDCIPPFCRLLNGVVAGLPKA